MPRDKPCIDKTMTVLEIVSEYPGTEEVFKSFDRDAGECINCNALFETLQAMAARYRIDLGGLIDKLLRHVSKSEHTSGL